MRMGVTPDLPIYSCVPIEWANKNISPIKLLSIFGLPHQRFFDNFLPISIYDN